MQVQATREPAVCDLPTTVQAAPSAEVLSSHDCFYDAMLLPQHDMHQL